MDRTIDQEFTSFHCCAEWHLSRLSSPCAVIYPFALRISKNSGKFTGSAGSVGRFFCFSLRTAQRGFRELRESGFFTLIESGKRSFEASTYGVLTHKEWAIQHPGECAEKFSYPWTAEGDHFGQKLWVASNCQVRFLPFQLKTYRDTGISEAEIISLFEPWYANHKADQQGKKWRKSVGYHFLMYLRREIESRARPHTDAIPSAPCMVDQPCRTDMRQMRRTIVR
jgi:hypothetical protein